MVKCYAEMQKWQFDILKGFGFSSVTLMYSGHETSHIQYFINLDSVMWASPSVGNYCMNKCKTHGFMCGI